LPGFKIPLRKTTDRSACSSSKRKAARSVSPIEIPVGDCKRPLAAAKVVEKYVRKAQEVVAADVAKRTADMLLDIETLAGIRPVLDLLAKRS
jgi:hypothetical protein